MRRPSLAWLIGLVLVAPPAAAGVIIVGLDGGADFTNIADAVAAANDGDLILIRTGSYPGQVVVDNKALGLQADLGANVILKNTLKVLNLAAGKTFTARGLTEAVSFHGCTFFASAGGSASTASPVPSSLRETGPWAASCAHPTSPSMTVTSREVGARLPVATVAPVAATRTCSSPSAATAATVDMP